VTPDRYTLAELPRQAAIRFGDKVALRSQASELTFREIESRIEACASGLSNLGVRAGDRVVVYLPNSWQWIVAYYAIARAGAVVVPANILLVPDEISFIAQDCGATAIVAPADRIDALRATAGGLTGRQLIAVGESARPGSIEWNSLLTARTPVSPVAVDPDAVSTIAYTSGTTGQPKGAILTHRAVVMNTAMTATLHARTPSDVVVTALPCPHVYGNVVMNGAFLSGYTLVLLERFDAEVALEAIERYRATLFEGVPTMYYYLLGAESLAKRKLGSLTRATVGGQTMPLPYMQEVQNRLGCPLIELWGMTEIAGLGTTHPLYGPERLGSIGVPLPFSECRIGEMTDPHRTVAAGERGELQFRGPTVMKGYYGRPDATAEVLLAGGWLRTGDIAYCDSGGYLYVVDRLKEMIITAGYNIYPSEVERVIAGHPAVQVVAVGAVPDAAKGELAHAYVVLKTAAGPLNEDTLMAYCRAHLGAYKVPKRIHFVADLPKTSTGKIMRRALRSLNPS
jgi:long-chain acyl-CoA synthetase